MNHRERMLATIKGEPTDGIPWAPRMDLWYIARQARDSVPDRFAGLNTAQIADQLDVACHSVRADYTTSRQADDLMLRGLGIDNHPDYPYRVEVRDIEVEFEQDEGNLKTVFHTPSGPITTHLQHTLEMKRDGISIPFVHSHAIQSPGDFEKVAHVFEHLDVIPNPEGYAVFRERVGDRGLAVAGGPNGAAPIHLVLHDLVAMDQFFYLYADEKDGLVELSRRMKPFFEAVLQALVTCDAEVVMWGANYDRDLTWPPFFSEHIMPWLKRVGERLHEGGKFLLTHTDGENEGLIPLYRECGFDVAESVCTEPMTKLSLAEIRAGMGASTTVWGGIPSVALLPESMDDQTFERYLDTVFDELGAGVRLILGVSDNVPPDADLSRLGRIKARVEAFGPVRP